jgi:hypothetical protein
VPIRSVRDEPETLAALLEQHALDQLIDETCGLIIFRDYDRLGKSKNGRSRHTYVQGLHRLELKRFRS